MGSDLPEWFNDKIEQWLFEEGISENSWTFDMLKDGSEWAFRELSKPENAAKIECVKPLIEAAQQTRQDIDTILKVRTEITIAMAEGHINDLDDALAPFKKEGE